MLLKLETEPVPKGRAKTIMRGGKVWSFTPQATKDAEAIIRALVQQQVLDAFPQHTPLSMTVTFYRTKLPHILKSETIPVRKPDLDNYIKTVLDALNGIAFPDDAQISTIIARKRWSELEGLHQDGAGYITIELQEDTL